MKSILIFIALAGSMFAQDQPPKPASTDKPAAAKKTAATKKTAKKTEAPPVAFLTIPKDATANGDGTFTYTDKAGKKWSYWNSPFGVMKSEIKPNTPVASSAAPAPAPFQFTSSTDKGDTVRFERQTPFGPMGYDRKKSEMSDAERNLFETQHPESKQTKPE